MSDFKLSSLSDDKLNEISSSLDSNSVFGVIGVCGIVGNLVARVLLDNGFKVIGTDMASKEDCKFKSAFDDYDIEIFYGGHPDGFFVDLDYVFVPPSLPKTAKVWDIIKEKEITILEIGDIFKLFVPDKPVICISGTNGKTTTTTLLKHIAYTAGIKPCEHKLEGMQGNTEFIPSLQSRLDGDVAILETGTLGNVGSIKSIASLSNASYGLLTNITLDHLDEGHDFIDYARVKGELVKVIDEHEGTLVVNSDDPIIAGLLKEMNYQGDIIRFGLDGEISKVDTKPCWCGNNVEVNEIISGVGTFDCENADMRDCGVKYIKPDYLAKNISIRDRTFTLVALDGEFEFKLAIDGLHNVYNSLGTIVLAHEALNISYEDIQKALLTFTGVPGRMELMGEVDSKTVMVDYAHNPAGVETTLHELSKLYDRISVVITVSSESGHDGDLDILNSALGNVDYIIPASYASNLASKELIESSKSEDYCGDYSYDEFKDIFIFPDEVPEEFIKVSTVGTDAKGVMNGFKTALKTDVDLIICIGEAAFKFDKNIKEFCKNH
ncbi:MAG: Mur ligase family protein [Methanobacteriaceae archaeon]|nr:Mur ligase family protein [Methanobacteriaceae archaeon]